MKEKKPKYYLNPEGEFIIENYNYAKPFASFFPGIAGKYGIPMWVFYVNRGQAIASFGTQDKDHAILEFLPANKAWQVASMKGFRTFIKIGTGKKKIFYEPFHNGFVNLNFDLTNKMSITSYDLKIEENNRTLGLSTKVEYFTIPLDRYAALARIVTFKNTAQSKKHLQVLDGLPQIIPFGISNLFLKKLNRTIEAWMKVKNLDKAAAFYKVDVDPIDRPQVIRIHEGHFYLGFLDEKNKTKIIRPIADPDCIFGPVTDFSCPQKFLLAEKFGYPREQILESKTPCGMSLLNLELKPQEEKTFYNLTGHIRSQEILNKYVPKIARADYLALKKEENKKVIRELQEDIRTSSSSLEFNLYAQQTYLDNIMRGGYPLPLQLNKGRAIFYLYSRKHGDLERDYNKFQLQATYFSQGNGNYRDVNQNRRLDVWFNPEIKEENLVALLNLIQADGFNPLVVKGASFTLSDASALENKLRDAAKEEEIRKIVSYLSGEFTPGDVLTFIEDNAIKLKISYDAFMEALLSCSSHGQEAQHGEGFWIDHWTYNLDLLESYLAIYPETYADLLFRRRDFTFYDNTETVKPRDEKYLLLGNLPKQLHSLLPDNTKRELIKNRLSYPHLVRTQYGKGEIYQTTLLNKLLCLLSNKLASLDPGGVGIEMEADKPSWYDALNGLPALFGSSVSETFELKRLVLFIQQALAKSNPGKIRLTEEIYHFLTGLAQLIAADSQKNSAEGDFAFWDKSHTLKEEYRYKTKFGFSGRETEVTADELRAILNNALKKLNVAIEKARDKKSSNIYSAYFINEPTEYAVLKDNFIKPARFRQRPLPLFLESQVHALRLTEDKNEAARIYKATRNSRLYDKKLKMYKVNAPLKGMPMEIGRCRAFTPGWLENESIWLHMEYKYLLEILKQGLAKEFYAEFKNLLIPFQDPARYGRSILENSSFLVSSAFPDKGLHGNGYVARLSGSTAEFLNIWLIMNTGIEPFFINPKNELSLRFAPILAGWLFKKDGAYEFNFLSKIRVTYHNPKRKDTFGKNSASVKKIVFRDKGGRPVEIPSGTIPHPYAEQIRSRQIKALDIFLS